MEEPTTKSSDFGVSSQTVSTSEILTADAVRKANESSSSGLSPGASAGIAVAVVLAIAILLVTLFIVYAYRYPTSKSGLWLIEVSVITGTWCSDGRLRIYSCSIELSGDHGRNPKSLRLVKHLRTE
jgi:hypothetical protein